MMRKMGMEECPGVAPRRFVLMGVQKRRLQAGKQYRHAHPDGRKQTHETQSYRSLPGESTCDEMKDARQQSEVD